MSFEETFNHEEQILLSSLPSLVGSAMTFAGASGLGTVKELIANSKALINGPKLFPTNSIINAIVPQMNTVHEGFEGAKEMRSRVQEHVQNMGIKSPEELRMAALEDAKKANAVLMEKADPAEASQYKRWVLDIAEEISKAAKEGGFLGFGGEQVSQGEKDFYTELAAAFQPLGA